MPPSEPSSPNSARAAGPAERLPAGPDATTELLEQSAEELYEDAPFGYVSCRQVDGPILRVNRTFCRWTGYAAAEVVGALRFQDLLSAAGRIVHGTRHSPLLHIEGVAEGTPLELLRANGSRLPVLINSVVKPAADGAPLLTRTTLFDATAYRRYEQRLVEARDQAERAEGKARRALAAAEAADRAKARFLAAMNHEFRTPIGIITGFADLLLQQARREGGARLDWLADIADAARHLLGLIEDATRYAALDTAAATLAQRPARLRQIARRGLEQAGRSLERAGVTAVLAEGDEVEAMLDPALAADALACVLRELGRRVSRTAVLWLDCRAGPPELAVCCPGLDLPQAVLDGLHAPLDATVVLTRGLEGAGLGIAVAGRIAALHGGGLRIDREGAGTRVRLRFGGT